MHTLSIHADDPADLETLAATVRRNSPAPVAVSVHLRTLLLTCDPSDACTVEAVVRSALRALRFTAEDTPRRREPLRVPPVVRRR